MELATRFAYVTYAHNVDTITKSTLNILLTVSVCGVCFLHTVSICVAHASTALVSRSMPLFDLNSRTKKKSTTIENLPSLSTNTKKRVNKQNYYRNDFTLYWTENYWVILRHRITGYSKFVSLNEHNINYVCHIDFSTKYNVLHMPNTWRNKMKKKKPLTHKMIIQSQMW